MSLIVKKKKYFWTRVSFSLKSACKINKLSTLSSKWRDKSQMREEKNVCKFHFSNKKKIEWEMGKRYKHLIWQSMQSHLINYISSGTHFCIALSSDRFAPSLSINNLFISTVLKRIFEPLNFLFNLMCAILIVIRGGLMEHKFSCEIQVAQSAITPWTSHNMNWKCAC